MNTSNIKNVYINNKSSTAWLGDKPVIGDFVEIIIRHNGFGKVKYKHHVYGSKKEPQRDNYRTIIKVLRNKPCTLTLIPDSGKGCNYAEWQDNNGNQTSSNINMTFTPNGNRMLYAWFGLDEFHLRDDYPGNEEINYYNTFPINIPVRKIYHDSNFSLNKHIMFSLPFTSKTKSSDIDCNFFKIKNNASAVINSNGGYDLNFDYEEVYTIKANLPYLLVRNSETPLIFEYCDNIKRKRTAIKIGTKGQNNSIEDIYILNTIQREELLPRKYIIFLSNNKLYTPNKNGNTLKPFRGYFYIYSDLAKTEDVDRINQYGGFPNSPSQY